MRPTALIPVLCAAAALVLGFLCLFAGQKKDFMEDYHIITVRSYPFSPSLLTRATNTMPAKYLPHRLQHHQHHYLRLFKPLL
jgi:hypothetical protein